MSFPRRTRVGIIGAGPAGLLLARLLHGGRLDRDGIALDGIELRFDGRSHRVDFPSPAGGSRVWVYAQTEVVKDLIALQSADGAPRLVSRLYLQVPNGTDPAAWSEERIWEELEPTWHPGEARG